MTNTYRITITGRNMMKPIPSIYIPAGNINVDVISFDITGDEWSDLQRIAVFVTEKKPIKVLLDVENKAVIPPEITSKKGMFSIGLWAVSLDEFENIVFRFSTNLVTGFVGEGACGDDYAESEKRQASAYEKLIYLIKSAAENTAVSEEKARKYAEQAQFAEQKAKEYSDNTVKNAETVSVDMQTTVEAAKSAAESSEIASQSAASASASAADAKGYAKTTEENAKITTDNSQTAVNAAESASESEAQAVQSAADAKAEADRISELSENVSANAQSVSENTAIAVKASEEAAESALLAKEAAEDVTSKANKNDVANALKGNAIGTTVTIDDISPIEHELSVKVRRKNLFNIANVKERTTSTSGVVRKTENGTAIEVTTSSDSATTRGATPNTLRDYAPELEVGKTYILSADTTGTSKYIYLDVPKAVWNFGTARTISENDLNSVVVWYASGVSTTAVISNIQIEEGLTATAYTPYIEDIASVGVSKCGKNLCDNVWEPGSIDSVNGSPYNTVGFRTVNYIPLKPNTTYTISKVNFTESLMFRFYDINKAYTGYISSLAEGNLVKTYTTKEDQCFVKLYAAIIDGTEPLIQLELDTTATEYEPYIKPQIYMPSEDGTVQGVTSLYPTTTITTDTDGVVIDTEYNRDLNKAFAEIVQAIVSMGGNI